MNGFSMTKVSFEYHIQYHIVDLINSEIFLTIKGALLGKQFAACYRYAQVGSNVTATFPTDSPPPHQNKTTGCVFTNITPLNRW